MPSAAPPTRSLPTVVIPTRNRRERLLATLARIHSPADRPPVVVIDNASADGTAAAVRRPYPGVRVIESTGALGSASRTLGVRAAETPLVAFTDDDSWWEPGALARAADLFDAYPDLGLIGARIIVEPRGTLDPTCAVMRESPLRADRPLPRPPRPPPGPRLRLSRGGGAPPRRSAVLECGGSPPRYVFGGEEHLLA